MPYRDVMNTILPPQNNHSAHITGHYGEHRDKGPHGGSDFNYEGGQHGVNLEHPTVHSPVAGTVTFVGGEFGTIKIRDADGNSHEILHTQSQSVKVGQRLEPGDPIATMGGRGPHGAEQYAQHVHYQMKDAQGHPINPETYWDQRPQQSPARHEAPAPISATPSRPHADDILRQGTQGDAVRSLQRELAQLGYKGRDGQPLRDDADFGPHTRHAVEAFQQAHGLKVDGAAGPRTLEKMAEALHQHQARGHGTQLNEPGHPDHALYRQALDGVHKLDAQHGRTPDIRSEQLAAAVTVSARQAGLDRIDLVALGTDGKHIFAAQGPLDSPFKRVAGVPSVEAMETPVSQSSLRWEQAAQQHAAHAQQQASQQQVQQPPQQQVHAPHV